MPQCVAVCCIVLQCVAVCCSLLQSAAVYCSLLQRVCCSNLVKYYKYAPVCCSVLQYVAAHCSVSQYVAARCSMVCDTASRSSRDSRVTSNFISVLVLAMDASAIESYMLQHGVQGGEDPQDALSL